MSEAQSAPASTPPVLLEISNDALVIARALVFIGMQYSNPSASAKDNAAAGVNLLENYLQVDFSATPPPPRDGINPV